MSQYPSLVTIAWRVVDERWIARCYYCDDASDPAELHSTASSWMRHHITTQAHQERVGAYRAAASANRAVAALRDVREPATRSGAT